MVAVAVLFVANVGLTLAVLALARQVGVLFERIAPMGALTLTGGPKVGDAAPVLRLRTLAGADVSVGVSAEEAEHRAFAQREKLGLPYVLSPELGMAFQIAKLPYAVVIGPDGRVRSKGLVNSREQLESLLEAEERGVASMQDYLKRESAAVDVS
jgi:hypothetical protein